MPNMPLISVQFSLLIELFISITESNNNTKIIKKNTTQDGGDATEGNSLVLVV